MNTLVADSETEMNNILLSLTDDLQKFNIKIK